MTDILIQDGNGQNVFIADAADYGKENANLLVFSNNVRKNTGDAMMVDIFKRLQLNNRCAINIIFATHSPFILSDIPNCNILYLEDGRQVKDICIEPFGANIHDILTQSFFLENGFIGEFAQKKIGEVIEAINKKKANKKKINEGEYERYKKTIDLIGEPLIKNKLMEMISEVYDNTEDRIKMLQKKIGNLRNKNQK